MSIPTVTMKLDDGTGTYPFDVSAFVNLKSLSLQGYGRADESTTASPATLQFTLKNNRGEFSALGLLSGAASTFEDGTTGGWTAGGTVPPTLSNTSVRALSGTKSLLITWGTAGTLPLAQRSMPGLTIGTQYTWSPYVYVPTGSPAVKAAVGGITQGQPSTVNDAWTRISVTFTATATTHNLQIWPNTSPTSGQTCNVDLAWINAGPVASFPINQGQLVQFQLTLGATTRTLFTGRIDSSATTWQGAPGLRSEVAVTATDALAELARRPMRSLLEEEILADDPAVYYRLSEPALSTSAGDISGNGVAPLTVTGSGTDVTFGDGIGPGVDGLTAAMFAGGKFLSSGDLTYSRFAGGASYTIECWFRRTGSPTGREVLAGGSQLLNLGMNASGQVVFQSFMTSPLSYNDGATHHAVGVFVFGGTSLLYVDGVQVASAGFGGGGTVPLVVGGDPVFGSLFNGTLSHVALTYSALSAARVLAHYQAGAGSAETTDARFARIAAYRGLATSTTSGLSGATVGAQPTSGASIMDALQQLADSEGGVIFVNGSGTLVMQGRNYRGLKTSSTWTFTGKDLDPGTTSVTQDALQMLNQVSATGASGVEQMAADQPSISGSGVYPETLALLTSDDDALAHASWLVATHKSPGKRIGSATFDLLNSPNATSLLQLELGDRVALTGLPTQAVGLGDVTVEGWSMDLSITGSSASWTLTVNLLPWSLNQVAIWDDPGSLWDSAVWSY